MALLWIGGVGTDQSLATRGGKGVTERGKYEEKEEDYDGEEDHGYEVEKLPFSGGNVALLG